MFDIGGGELMLILIAVLIFFGPKKLPELAQSLGRGLREFKRAQREFTDHINQAIDQESQRSTGTVARRSSLPPDRPVIPPSSETIYPPAESMNAGVPPQVASADPGYGGETAEPRSNG